MNLIQMSLSGGGMILAAILLRWLALYRLPKRFLAALWGLPLIRLLIPFSIPAKFSIYSLLSQQNPPVSVAAASPAPARVRNPEMIPAAPAAEAPFSVDLLAVLWLIGLLACALYFTAAYIRCRWEFRESLPVNSSYVRAWLQAHPLLRTVSVRYSDRIVSPLTYGVLRPVILLPKSTNWDDCTTLDYVLTHEFVHIRRFDALHKLVLALALCVHWFNPLVWVMYALANRDMELACDEAVLLQFGQLSRANYALTLIDMEEKKNRQTLISNHFSKNSIEERIKAIMKMKKHSLAILLAAVILTGGSTAIFATSAKAENTGAAVYSDYTVENKDCLMSFTHADGTTYYSWDGGETWTAMTDEEFSEAYPSPDVEWWTAEEYAAWLEKEKESLQSIVGSKSWTASTGWFTWTQEMVTETIAEYEELLALIQSGYLVSKTVDGSEDSMLVMNPLDQFLGDGAYEAEKKALEYDSTSSLEDGDHESLLAEYQRFGLKFDHSDGNLYWNGQRVRIFVDGVDHEDGFFSQYDHYDPEGQIDLHTVRERIDNGDGSYNPMGPLVKIEEFLPDLMFLDELEAHRYFSSEIAYETTHTAEMLEPFAPFGLTYQTDSNTGKLTMDWNGQSVRSVFDAERQFLVANSLGRNGLDLEAVYEDKKLVGLRVSENEDREFAETGTVIYEKTAADDTQGQTIAQRMEQYAPYGVTYTEHNDIRIIRFNGQTVESFSDLHPGGSVFSVDSTHGGEIRLVTVYDQSGNLCGVEIANS